jgi:hypothetical protein
VSARFPTASPRFETDDRKRPGIAPPKRRENRAHRREIGVVDARKAMNGRLLFSFGMKRTGYRVFKIQHGSMDGHTQAFSTDSGCTKPFIMIPSL